jgi:SAM-dependent methyltransferase
MVDYYLEYGGGLGDIFYQLFQDGSYQSLEELRPEDRVSVALITHNPHVRELFEFHPKASQIDLRDCGYWTPEQDAEMRRRLDLPDGATTPPPASSPGALTFYPSPSDLAELRQLETRHFVVFSVSAGLSERNVPGELVEELAARVRAQGLLPVFVGRSYERFDRREYEPGAGVALNLIDRLSVPGVARAVGAAAGVVCCHSSVNILAWLLRKPQLLLYPASAYSRHIAPRDQWAFGVDFPECRHAQFDDAEMPRLAGEFLSLIDARLCEPAREENMMTTEARARVTSIPIPPESQSIQLDEGVSRLTPAHEVKLLAWLADRCGGNVVEIGCNKGLTTRDLAARDSRRIVYAVDYFGGDAAMLAPQQGERPSPDDFCVHARHLPNVVCLHERGATLNYDALRDVRLVFIDGDHSYAAVRADTERALDFFSRNDGGTLVWHDYYEGGPQWVGVKKFVDTLDLEIKIAEGTWMAFAEVAGRR